MTESVAKRVAIGGTAILLGTLLVVGLGTGAVLHSQRVEAVDAALLAAAHGRAHPEIEAEVEVEHSRPPVDTWIVHAADARVSPELVHAARRSERPVYADVGDERIVLLPFDVEGQAEEEEQVAAAAAPRVTLRSSIGPFALVYLALAALAALLATAVQLRLVRRAFAPLNRATDEAARVLGFGDDQRLTPDAPEEIEPLLVAINELLDRLQISYEAQGRFTAEAAHELRTPVTTMLGELDVALRNARSADEYETVLRSVREEVQRLRQLVDGLTALTRIDVGEVEQHRELMRAGELAARAVESEKDGLQRAGCDVRLDVDDDPEIEVHPSLMEAAMANLLRNAARHAPGADVVLRVVRERDGIAFLVDDSGPGLGPTDREALFARFVRKQAGGDRSGLGLGLPLAREVARRHGGDCTLDESPTGGVRARLWIPARRGGQS